MPGPSAAGDLQERRRTLALGVAAVCVVVATRIPQGGLLFPEEARYAELAREMAESPDGLPRLNGVLYFEKPPLLPWLGGRLLPFDPSGDGVILRWIPALTSLAACAAVGWAGTRAGGPRLGAAAASLYAVMPMTWAFSHSFTTDGPFADALTVALCAAAPPRARGRPAIGAAAAGALALAFASLVRSPLLAAGLYAPAALVLGWSGGFVKSVVRAVIPLTAGLALAAPWFAAIQCQAPSFFREFFVNQHFGRVGATDAEKVFHSRSALYYVPQLALGLGLVAPPALWAAVAGWRRGAGRYTAAALWILTALSLVSGKRAPYILPAFPWMALALTRIWVEAPRGGAFVKVLTGAFAVSAAAAAAAAAAGILLRAEPPLVDGAVLAVAVAGGALAAAALFARARGQAPAASAVAAAAGIALILHAVDEGAVRLTGGPARLETASSPAPGTFDAADLRLSGAGFDATIPLDPLQISRLCKALAPFVKPEDGVANHRRYRHALGFYARRPTELFAGPAELAFGLDAAGPDAPARALFHRETDLAAALDGDRRLWVLGELRDFFVSAPDFAALPRPLAVRADKPPYAGLTLHVHARAGKYFVFSNRP